MTTTLVVVYEPGSNFRVEPYMSRHVPLLRQHLGSIGLTGFRLLLGDGGDNKASYEAMALVDFESKEALGRMFTLPAEVAAVVHDVSYFSDKPPKMWQATPVEETQ